MVDDRIIREGMFMPLRDLREWHEVSVTCWKCRSRGVLRIARLKRAGSPQTKLYAVAERLRCRNCGIKGPQELVVKVKPRND